MNSIEELSIAGLGQRLFKIFSLPDQPIECPTGDLLHLVQKVRSNKGEGMKLPVVGYSLSTISESEYANPTAAMFRGVNTAAKEETIGCLRALPVKLTFDLRYVDNDRIRVLRFLAKWMEAGARGLLNFRLRVDGAPIDIQVKPDGSLTVPLKESTPDASNVYDFAGTLTMNTYVTGPFDESLTVITRLKTTTIAFDVGTTDTQDILSVVPRPSLEEIETNFAAFDDVAAENLLFVVQQKNLGG